MSCSAAISSRHGHWPPRSQSVSPRVLGRREMAEKAGGGSASNLRRGAVRRLHPAGRRRRRRSGRCLRRAASDAGRARRAVRRAPDRAWPQRRADAAAPGICGDGRGMPRPRAPRCRRSAGLGAASRHRRSHARPGGLLRQGARAIRPADRFVPGRQAPLREYGDCGRSALVPARCGSRIAARDARDDAAFQIAALRLLAPKAALANARTCIQVHGGIGFSAEADAHHYLKQAHLLRQLGSGAAMLDLPAPLAPHQIPNERN